MSSIWDIANPQLRGLRVYEPGKPIEETARELGAAIFGARTIEVPSPDLRHHLDAMIAVITSKTRLIFIANPNNPTGTLAGQEEIDRFIERVPENIVVVFDEAYFEYLDDPPD